VSIRNSKKPNKAPHKLNTMDEVLGFSLFTASSLRKRLLAVKNKTEIRE